MSVAARGSPTRSTSHSRAGSAEFFSVIRSPVVARGSIQQVRYLLPERKSACTNIVIAVTVAARATYVVRVSGAARYSRAMTTDDRLTTLEALWSIWARQGQALTDEQWRQPTRLGDWDVRSLFAHAGLWPSMLSTLLERVTDAEPTHASAAALLRDFNAPDGVAHSMREAVATGAREGASRYSTAQMVDQFASTGPRALTEARRLGPVAVDYFGMAVMPFGEAISIGILEATVHLLDLLRALDQPPEVPADGLAHTSEVLLQMASPIDFIEAATGRHPPELFPILS